MLNQRHPTEILNYAWFEMDEGETVRIPCSHWKCQEKNNALTVTRLYDGVIYNCYRCATSGKIHANNTPSQAQIKLNRMRSRKRVEVTEDYMGFGLPKDFVNLVLTSSGTIAERSYLYRYEIEDTDIVEFNIGYSKQNQSIIYPIYDKLAGLYELIGYQERYNYSSRDNYNINRTNKYNTVLNKYIISKYFNNYIYYNIENNNNNKLILVEDILSAIKCYKATGYNVKALLNTSVTTKTIHRVSGYDKVYLWLDFDQRTEVLKKVKYLKSWGINAKSIVTEKDPKAVPLTRIKKIICG